LAQEFAFVGAMGNTECGPISRTHIIKLQDLNADPNETFTGMPYELLEDSELENVWPSDADNKFQGPMPSLEEIKACEAARFKVRHNEENRIAQVSHQLRQGCCVSQCERVVNLSDPLPASQGPQAAQGTMVSQKHPASDSQTQVISATDASSPFAHRESNPVARSALQEPNHA